MRLAGVAVAGYYPLPEALIDATAALVAPIPGEHRDAFLDPCAGKGEALFGMLKALYPAEERGRVGVYAAELEESRHRALANASYAFRHGAQTDHDLHSILHCDALRIQVGEPSKEKPGVSCLYLNPPYDSDNRYKRSEERFLQRFTPALMPRGALLFVVPAHALTASAETLATQYDAIDVFRFPDGEYEAFKQVVLRARRATLPRTSPHEGLLALVKRAAAEPLTLPVLGDPTIKAQRLPVPRPRKESWQTVGAPGRAKIAWEARLLDVAALRELHRPWHATDKHGRGALIEGVFPADVVGALHKRYRMAVPPKPAHIAQGIAAGVFNGVTLIPDAPDSEAPPIVVKGRFAREWKTVRERFDAKGNKVSEDQVEEPRLEVTALDLRSLEYTTLKSTPEPTGACDPAAMTTGDLLTQYPVGMLTALRAHCPVTHDPHDPAHAILLTQTARPLYPAQAHAAMAMVKLLGGVHASRRSRRGKFCALIGEVGCGKTGTFLVAARNVGARYVLTLCPPHLVDSWRDEVSVVWPEARFVLIDSVGVVDALLAEKEAARNAPVKPAPVVAVLTRETAKLGHGYESLTRCGRCGAKAPKGDHAEQRSLCKAPILAATTTHAMLAVEMRDRLRGALDAFPGKPRMAADPEAGYTGRDRALYSAALRALDDPDAERQRVARGLAFAVADDRLRLDLCRRLNALDDDSRTLRILAMCVAPDVEGFDALIDEFAPKHRDPLRAWSAYLNADTLDEVTRPRGNGPYGGDEYYDVRREGHDITFGGSKVGEDVHALAGLNVLGETPFKPCKAPLYQAVPRPRRYAIAQYIQRRAPDLFDVLGLDEAHELSGEGTAQERAAHRLTGLGMPTVLLTGSLVNGYAEHLFAHLWALSPEFRKRFARDGKGVFARQYGYRKRRVDEKVSKVRARGAVTDRVETDVHDTGAAPGVQPLAVLEWLLPFCVTLHKAELNLDLPPLTAERVPVQPTPAMLTVHKEMLEALFKQIKTDQFTELTGALWGQLSEAPSHLDRMTADIGNCETGAWRVQYPPERDGGRIVYEAPPLPAEDILPKEAAMLDALKAELAADRPCIVLAWHTALCDRYARLIRAATGEKVAVLHADKVTPAKRQAWISKQTAAGVKVLVTNPVAIQTGLNVLTYYATQLWMQNPSCNAIVYRQAVGRIDRIGQRKPPKVLFFVYADSLQAPLHSLLLSKVAVSQSTDGLDARSALQAAGVGETGSLTSLTVGKILFELLEGSQGGRLQKAMRLSMYDA